MHIHAQPFPSLTLFISDTTKFELFMILNEISASYQNNDLVHVII